MLLRQKAFIVQYSSGTKFLISLSRLTTISSAADCTRPAELPFDALPENWRDFVTDKSVENAPCLLAVDKVHIEFSGVFDCVIDRFLLISLKTIRFLPSGISRQFLRCQLIASPSRSGSVARYTTSFCLSADLSLLMVSFFSGLISYSGSNPCSTSMPNVFAEGRRRDRPMRVPCTLVPNIFGLFSPLTAIRL